MKRIVSISLSIVLGVVSATALANQCPDFQQLTVNNNGKLQWHCPSGLHCYFEGSIPPSEQGFAFSHADIYKAHALLMCTYFMKNTAPIMVNITGQWAPQYPIEWVNEGNGDLRCKAPSTCDFVNATAVARFN